MEEVRETDVLMCPGYIIKCIHNILFITNDYLCSIFGACVNNGHQAPLSMEGPGYETKGTCVRA